MALNMRELTQCEIKNVQGGLLLILATAAGAYAGVKTVRWLRKKFK